LPLAKPNAVEDLARRRMEVEANKCLAWVADRSKGGDRCRQRHRRLRV
jgi:hypothetical protein